MIKVKGLGHGEQPGQHQADDDTRLQALTITAGTIMEVHLNV